MSWNRIKPRPADKIFSEYVRAKAGYRCEKCGKLCKVGGEWIAQLDASHYFSRRYESVRFDTDNVRSVCSSCHRRMGGKTKDENGEYDLWVKELLGEQGFNLLKARANLPGKKDDQAVILVYKALLKELESS